MKNLFKNELSLGILQGRKDELMPKLFPFAIRFSLIPELNVITVEVKSKFWKTDDLLSNLLSKDSGDKITVTDQATI